MKASQLFWRSKCSIWCSGHEWKSVNSHCPPYVASACSTEQLNRLSDVWHWSNSFSWKKKANDLMKKNVNMKKIIISIWNYFWLTPSKECVISMQIDEAEERIRLMTLGKKSSVREQKWKRKCFPIVKASPASPRLPYIVEWSEPSNLSVNPMARGSGGGRWIAVLLLEDGERSYDR